MMYFSILAHINVSGTVQTRYMQAGTVINVRFPSMKSNVRDSNDYSTMLGLRGTALKSKTKTMRML